MSRTHYLRIRVALLSLFLLAAATATLPADSKDSKPKVDSFATVLQAHFKEWDLDHDGKLSPDEINKLISDPSIKGSAAAVLAAIHVYQRSKKVETSPVSLDQLMALPKATRSERREMETSLAHIDGNYESFLRHINKCPRELFAEKSAPALDGFHQGKLGDCYYVAPVGACVHRSSEAVRKMFNAKADGSCEVRFGNGVTVHVPKLTDAEIALGSTAGDQGLWLNVLEKAFAMAEAHYEHKEGDAVSMDMISKGGKMGHTIPYLTGHKAEYIYLRKAKDSKEKAIDSKELLAKLRKEMQAAESRHGIICCSAPKDGIPPGIVGNHVYAILHFDAAQDAVHVWNPWGNKFTPKGRDGLENGYETKNGHFAVPLKEFVTFFGSVAYETTTAAETPQKKK